MLDPTTPLEGVSDRLASPPLPVELIGLDYETGGKRVINDLNATIDTRRITVIMGPNGAGKSILPINPCTRSLQHLNPFNIAKAYRYI